MNPAVLASQSDIPVTLLASVLIWFMFFALMVLWFVDGRVKRLQITQALLSAVIAWTLTQMIKELLPAVRPYETNGQVPLTLTIPFDSAFPSAHAAVAFALATSIYIKDHKLGLYFFIGAIGVGLGRILSNVHYLGDVLGGIAVGVIVAYLLAGLHPGPSGRQKT